ncbi:hypothetical protein CYMTET_13357, partial [Cymbomonas tetramitiformis]
GEEGGSNATWTFEGSPAAMELCGFALGSTQLTASRVQYVYANETVVGNETGGSDDSGSYQLVSTAELEDSEYYARLGVTYLRVYEIWNGTIVTLAYSPPAPPRPPEAMGVQWSNFDPDPGPECAVNMYVYGYAADTAEATCLTPRLPPQAERVGEYITEVRVASPDEAMQWDFVSLEELESALLCGFPPSVTTLNIQFTYAPLPPPPRSPPSTSPQPLSPISPPFSTSSLLITHAPPSRPRPPPSYSPKTIVIEVHILLYSPPPPMGNDAVEDVNTDIELLVSTPYAGTEAETCITTQDMLEEAGMTELTVNGSVTDIVVSSRDGALRWEFATAEELAAASLCGFAMGLTNLSITYVYGDLVEDSASLKGFEVQRNVSWAVEVFLASPPAPPGAPPKFALAEPVVWGLDSTSPGSNSSIPAYMGYMEYSGTPEETCISGDTPAVVEDDVIRADMSGNVTSINVISHDGNLQWEFGSHEEVLAAVLCGFPLGATDLTVTYTLFGEERVTVGTLEVHVLESEAAWAHAAKPRHDAQQASGPRRSWSLVCCGAAAVGAWALAAVCASAMRHVARRGLVLRIAQGALVRPSGLFVWPLHGEELVAPPSAALAGISHGLTDQIRTLRRFVAPATAYQRPSLAPRRKSLRAQHAGGHQQRRSLLQMGGPTAGPVLEGLLDGAKEGVLRKMAARVGRGASEGSEALVETLLTAEAEVQGAGALGDAQSSASADDNDAPSGGSSSARTRAPRLTLHGRALIGQESHDNPPHGHGPHTTPHGHGPHKTPRGNGLHTTPRGHGPHTAPRGNGLHTTPRGHGPHTTPRSHRPHTTPRGNGMLYTPRGNASSTAFHREAAAEAAFKTGEGLSALPSPRPLPDVTPAATSPVALSARLSNIPASDFWATSQQNSPRADEPVALGGSKSRPRVMLRPPSTSQTPARSRPTSASRRTPIGLSRPPSASRARNASEPPSASEPLAGPRPPSAGRADHRTTSSMTSTPNVHSGDVAPQSRDVSNASTLEGLPATATILALPPNSRVHSPARLAIETVGTPCSSPAIDALPTDSTAVIKTIVTTTTTTTTTIFAHAVDTAAMPCSEPLESPSADTAAPRATTVEAPAAPAHRESAEPGEWQKAKGGLPHRLPPISFAGKSQQDQGKLLRRAELSSSASPQPADDLSRRESDDEEECHLPFMLLPNKSPHAAKVQVDSRRASQLATCLGPANRRNILRAAAAAGCTWRNTQLRLGQADTGLTASPQGTLHAPRGGPVLAAVKWRRLMCRLRGVGVMTRLRQEASARLSLPRDALWKAARCQSPVLAFPPFALAAHQRPVLVPRGLPTLSEDLGARGEDQTSSTCEEEDPQADAKREEGRASKGRWSRQRQSGKANGTRSRGAAAAVSDSDWEESFDTTLGTAVALAFLVHYQLAGQAFLWRQLQLAAKLSWEAPQDASLWLYMAVARELLGWPGGWGHPASAVLWDVMSLQRPDGGWDTSEALAAALAAAQDGDDKLHNSASDSSGSPQRRSPPEATLSALKCISQLPCGCLAGGRVWDARMFWQKRCQLAAQAQRYQQLSHEQYTNGCPGSMLYSKRAADDSPEQGVDRSSSAAQAGRPLTGTPHAGRHGRPPRGSWQQSRGMTAWAQAAGREHPWVQVAASRHWAAPSGEGTSRAAVVACGWVVILAGAAVTYYTLGRAACQEHRQFLRCHEEGPIWDPGNARCASCAYLRSWDGCTGQFRCRSGFTSAVHLWLAWDRAALTALLLATGSAALRAVAYGACAIAAPLPAAAFSDEEMRQLRRGAASGQFRRRSPPLPSMPGASSGLPNPAALTPKQWWMPLRLRARFWWHTRGPRGRSPWAVFQELEGMQAAALARGKSDPLRDAKSHLCPNIGRTSVRRRCLMLSSAAILSAAFAGLVFYSVWVRELLGAEGELWVVQIWAMSALMDCFLTYCFTLISIAWHHYHFCVRSIFT